jgi:hypothetical protein
MIGGTDYQLFRSRRGTAKVRLLDDSDDKDVIILPLILPFRFVVQAGVLKAAPDDAVLLLRLGGVSNALLTVLGWNVRTERDGSAKSRDLVHVTMIVASCINELRVILEQAKPSSAHLWELAERASSPADNSLWNQFRNPASCWAGITRCRNWSSLSATRWDST